MSVPAMGGEWGIAPQAAGKIGSGSFVPSAYTWRRYRSPQIDMGMQEIAQPFPQEISGFLTPTGWYKGGVSFGGSVDMLPRTESVMGYLLYALMGDVSSVTGKDQDGVASTNTYTHYFRYNALNTIPWFAQRLKVPGQTSSDVLSIYGYDCKVNAMQFRLSATGKLTCRIGLLGRVPQLEENPTYVWSNNLEDDTSVPQACSASVTIGGQSPSVVSMQVDVVNTLSAQQEFVFGSYFMDDMIPLARGATIRVQTKWNNPDLYQLATTNLTNGTAWTPTPYIVEGLMPAASDGFALKADSQKTIPSSSPAKLDAFSIRGNRVVWVKDGNPSMQAGGIVMQSFIGTVVTPTITTEDYIRIILQNGTNGYLWS